MDLERFEPVLCLLDDYSFHRRRRRAVRLILGVVGLTALTLIVYARAVWTSGFFLHDKTTLNDVDSWFRLTHLWTHSAGGYRPFALSLLWIERRFFGNSPFPYHCVSLIAHVANTIILWFILRRLDIRGGWLLAALFAVHPIQVQSVLWISQQPVVIGGVFYLLAISIYLRWSSIAPPLPPEYESNEPKEDSEFNPLLFWGAYTVALVLSFAAMASDAVGISLPVVLMLLILWKKETLLSTEWAALVPFFAIGASVMALNLFLRHSSVQIMGISPTLSAVQRILVGACAIGFYALHTLKPYSSTLIYPRWDPGVLNYVLALSTLLGGLTVCAGRRRWGNIPIFLMLLFVFMLLPGLLLVFLQPAPSIYIADHQQYLAAAIPLAVIGASVLYAADRMFASISPRVTRASIGVFVIGSLVTFAIFATFGYRDSQTGLRTALWHDPSNVLVRANYALLLSEDDPAKGLQVLDDAGPAGTNDLTLLDTRAKIALFQGQYDQAIATYLLAQRLAPDRAEIRIDLAEAYDLAGAGAVADHRRDEAREWYTCALASYQAAGRLIPKDESICDGIGKVMLHEGRFDQSLAQFDSALQLDAAYVPARIHRAQALFNIGLAGNTEKITAAMSELQQAIRIDPANVEVLCAAADMQMQLRNFSIAEADCRTAVLLDPKSPQAWIDLGTAQSAQNRFREALWSFDKALQLRAGTPAATRGKRLATAQLAMAAPSTEQAQGEGSQGQ